MGREAGTQGEAWACKARNPQTPAFSALSSLVLKPAPPPPPPGHQGGSSPRSQTRPRVRKDLATQ